MQAFDTRVENKKMKIALQISDSFAYMYEGKKWKEKEIQTNRFTILCYEAEAVSLPVLILLDCNTVALLSTQALST